VEPLFVESEAKMPHVRFDPSKAVTFDLKHGLVHLDGAPSRLLVPAEALGALCAAAGDEATQSFGRAIGLALGRRVASRLAASAESDGATRASVEAMVEHLGGELALSGLGSMGIERWGRAMVMVVDQSPLGAEGDALLEAVLASALEGAAGRATRAIFLGRETVRARFLITGEAGAQKVKAWLSEGLSWGDALVRLHANVEPAKAQVESPGGDA